MAIGVVAITTFVVTLLVCFRFTGHTPYCVLVPLVDGAVLLVKSMVEDHTLDAALAELRNLRIRPCVSDRVGHDVMCGEVVERDDPPGRGAR